jgi:hypothetical protein
VSRSKAQHIWDRRDAVQSYNIVLTKLAFVPHIYHFLYTCILPYIPLVEPDAMDLLNMVDRVRNCEDIVMQGLASVVAGKQSPLVVRGLSSADLADYGSTDDQHAISMGEHASLWVTSAGNPMTMTRLSGFDAHLWQRGQCVVAVQQTLGRGEYASSIFSEQTSVAAPFEAAPVPVQRDRMPVCSVVNTMNAVWRTAAGAPALEESPGSTGIRCRLTAGGGDPRESATESKPPGSWPDGPPGKGERVR